MPRKRHITPPAMRRELVTRQQKAFEKYQESGVTCYGYGPRPQTEIAWLKVWGEPVPDELIGTATPAEEARVARWKRRHSKGPA